MARVGFDLDGVLYDFEGALRDYLVSLGNTHPMPQATVWGFYEQWGLSKAEFNEVCLDALLNGNLFSRLDPFPGAKEAVWRIREAGHEVVYITARHFGRPEEVERQTLGWLAYYGFPIPPDDAELHFKSGRDKHQIPVDYFIDDNLDNYASLYDAGVDVFLCDRPYNRNFLLTRRGTLEDYVDRVLADADPKESVADYIVRTDEVRVTSSTGGAKGKKLARFDLIPPRAWWQIAELFGIGAEKYEDWNWRKGYDWSLSIAALERHFNLFKQGIDNDNHEPDCLPECDKHTGMPHLTSVVFHALTLLTFMDEQREFDDRYSTKRSEGLKVDSGTSPQPTPAKPSVPPQKAGEEGPQPDHSRACKGSCCMRIG